MPARPAALSCREAALLANAAHGGLLDRDNLHGSDVGIRSEQVRGYAGERLRDLAVEVGLAALLVLERVEDAVGRLADFERVPGHRADFGDRKRSTFLEEPAKVTSLVGLGLQQGEYTEPHGHVGPSVVGLPSRILSQIGLDSPESACFTTCTGLSSPDCGLGDDQRSSPMDLEG